MRIGVGIVGIDHWYNLLPLLRQFQHSEDFRVISISGSGLERIEQLASDINAEVTADTAQVFEDPRVDLVAIFSSTEQSASLAIAAARAGKHILANKPLGMTIAEAEQVVAEVTRAEVAYFPYESSARLSPLGLALQGWITEGRIGEIQAISCSHEASLPVQWEGSSVAGWWTHSDRTPGGGWIDHAIYQVDLARWLTGAELVSSHGQVGRIKHRHLAVEDYGTATFMTDSGVVVTCEAHWFAPEGAFRRTVEITGSRGVILFDSTDDRIRIFDPEGSEGKGGDHNALTRIQGDWKGMPTPDSSSLLLDHVAQLVRGEVQPVATVRDGKANLEACLTFYQSATELL